MDKAVIEKCLAFCQALTNSNKQFSLSLTMGSELREVFNFSSKGLDKSSSGKKNKSPPQFRREDRKRATAKADEVASKVSAKSVLVVKPKCNHCNIVKN